MRDNMMHREDGPGFRGRHGAHNPGGNRRGIPLHPEWHAHHHMWGHGHGRGHGFSHEGGNAWGDFFAGEQSGFWGDRPGGRARGRDRMERGMLRYIILSVLNDGPKHGYEIIKVLEERTSGRYSPSPGTLYPTLQYMEDLSLVRSDQEADRRVYHLTEAGSAELQAHAGFVENFWSRFSEHTPSRTSLHELKFVGDALGDLVRTVKGGLRGAAIGGDQETIRSVRMALERCENEVREIIAQSDSNTGGDRNNPAAHDSRPGEA